LLKNFPEVSLEIRESGHGLRLSFLELTSRQSHSKSPAALEGAYLKPGIQHGLLEMTIPDKPQSRLQKYRLTPAGKTLAVAITSKK
jgi:ATP-dependent DNA helicase RecG